MTILIILHVCTYMKTFGNPSLKRKVCETIAFTMSSSLSCSIPARSLPYLDTQQHWKGRMCGNLAYVSSLATLACGVTTGTATVHDGRQPQVFKRNCR